MKVKVISLNMWQGAYLDRVVDWLQRQSPDVVMVQEVVENGQGEFENVNFGGFSRLRKVLKMNGVYKVMAEVCNQKGKYEFGVAVLSRLEHEVIEPYYYWNKKIQISQLSEINRAYPGLVVGLKVGVGKRNLNVYSTHFVWSLYPEVSEAQIGAARNLRNYLADKEELILGGDLNMTTDSLAFEILSDKLVNDQPEGLESTLHPTIHKVGEMNLAIDYLLHRGDGIKLIKSFVPVEPISDHLPVVAEYRVG